MPRFTWDDASGPEDYDWDERYYDVFAKATGYEEGDSGSEWARAAALYDAGFVTEQNEYARDWFFEFMVEHGFDIADFDWDTWRDAYEEAG